MPYLFLRIVLFYHIRKPLVFIVACFLMNMIVSGTFRSQGIIFVELLDLFECSSSETVWVFSIAGLFVNILGKLVKRTQQVKLDD